MEVTYQQYKDQGLMVVMSLASNNEGQTPSAEDLAEWADYYGQTFPVVSDAGWQLENRFAEDGGIPTWSLLAPGAVVVARDDWGAEDMIEDNLPKNYKP